MTSLRYAACLPRPLVFFELSLPFVNVVDKMPPKSKEIDSRKELREGERGKNSGEGTSRGTVSVGDDISLSDLVAMPKYALDTDDQPVDPSFRLDSSVRSH